MDDLFSDLRDDDFLEETSPIGDLPETEQMGDLPQTQPLSVDDDEFDMLRQKTVRTESTYSGMDTSDDEFDSGSGFSLNNFNTSQKLILLALLMLDIVAVGFGVMVLMGRI
jgi:hypothetical protein